MSYKDKGFCIQVDTCKHSEGCDRDISKEDVPDGMLVNYTTFDCYEEK